MGTVLEPLPTANLVSCGDHSALVAAAVMRRITSIGFHSVPSSVHTYAFRSCEVVTMRLVLGAHAMSVISASCSLRVAVFSHGPSGPVGFL